MEEITPVKLGELIETITTPILRRYLFWHHITRLVYYIAVASLLVWVGVLFGVIVYGW